MEDRAQGLADDALEEVLGARWEVQGTLTYVPLGFGSYHWRLDEAQGERLFVTVDDLGRWRRPDEAYSALGAALAGTAHLRWEADLEFVVAPRPDLDGEVVAPLPPHFAVAVYPYVDGRSGSWGDDIPPEVRDELFRHLARLHAVPRSLAPGVRNEGGSPSFIADLRDALEATGEAWSGGPFAEPARRLLLDRRWYLAEKIARFQDLAHRCGADSDRRVLTHGETHPGNLMRAHGELLLIDWDTLGTALPERDLWAWDDGSEKCFAAYEAALGRTVDRTACAAFRLAWDLKDLAAYLDLFRSPHEHSADPMKSWRGVDMLLSPKGD